MRELLLSSDFGRARREIIKINCKKFSKAKANTVVVKSERFSPDEQRDIAATGLSLVCRWWAHRLTGYVAEGKDSCAVQQDVPTDGTPNLDDENMTPPTHLEVLKPFAV